MKLSIRKCEILIMLKLFSKIPIKLKKIQVFERSVKLHSCLYLGVEKTNLEASRFRRYPDVQLFCWSVAKLGLALCDPMDCGTPGFPVLHHLLELVQTHVH